MWRQPEQSPAEVNHLHQHSCTANGKQTHNLSSVCLCAPTLLSSLSCSSPTIYPRSSRDSKPDTDALRSIRALPASVCSIAPFTFPWKPSLLLLQPFYQPLSLSLPSPLLPPAWCLIWSMMSSSSSTCLCPPGGLQFR